MSRAPSFPPFRARLPWWGADLQTIRNQIRPAPDLSAWPADSIEIPLEDGDLLAATLSRPGGGGAGRPLMVLLHGLTGDQDSSYVRATAAALLAAGFPVLRANQRGAGPTLARCRRFYHAGRSADLAHLLEHVPAAQTSAGSVLVGYSLGGNVVLKLLGELGAGAANLGIRAGVSVSAPIELSAAADRIEARRNRLYQDWLVRRMRADVRALGGGDHPFNQPWLDGIRSVRDFDDKVVAPWNGWADAAEYYRVNSARQFLPRIAVPSLIIHARDDPWIPATPYDGVDWAAHGALTPLLAPGGGHVGFHGAGHRVAWHDRCILHFLARLGLDGAAAGA